MRRWAMHAAPAGGAERAARVAVHAKRVALKKARRRMYNASSAASGVKVAAHGCMAWLTRAPQAV